MTQPQGEEIQSNQVYGHYKSWLSYQPYIKMMACVDMFLNEFPFHPYAQARIGTIISRFKDCSVLLSTYLTTKYLGLSFTEFAPWIWNRSAAVQFARVVRGGEEMDNSRSCAMYFRDFFLSEKSPYSTQLNPDLHLFYHTIGVSGSVLRCSHARFVGNPEVNAIIANAQIVHFVFGELPKFGMHFTEGGIPIEAPEDLVEVLPDAMPNVPDAAAWLGYLQERHNRIPRMIKA